MRGIPLCCCCFEGLEGLFLKEWPEKTSVPGREKEKFGAKKLNEVKESGGKCVGRGNSE